MTLPNQQTAIERLEGLLADSTSPITATRHRAKEKLRRSLPLLIEVARAAEPFVRHGRAAGALGGDDGPFWIMTDEGHRDVPAADFRALASALKRLEEGK